MNSKSVLSAIDDLLGELDTVDGLAHRRNGSISAEHGVGVAKRDDLSAYKSEVEPELMWQIKCAPDPNNLLNPAKVLPQAKRKDRAPAETAAPHRA